MKHSVNVKVNATHAHERRLEAPKTRFAHRYTAYSLRQWTSHEALWSRRLADPRWIIPAVFGTAAAPEALCIARAESGLDPAAYNPSSAAGLFQMESFWYDGSSAYGWVFDPFDAWQNTIHAHLLYQHSGWSPWTGDPCVG